MGTTTSAGFAALAYYHTMSLNNVHRCPLASMLTQHPLNCPDFRVQHGYGQLDTQECVECTSIIKRNPPAQMRQPPMRAAMSVEAGRYHDEPLPPGPNPARPAINHVHFVPGLSQYATSENTATSAPQAQPEDFLRTTGNRRSHVRGRVDVADLGDAQATDNQPSNAPGRVGMAKLGEVIRPRQSRRLSRQQAQGNLSSLAVTALATPSVRPRSASRNRVRNPEPSSYPDPSRYAEPSLATMTLDLLDEAHEANWVLTLENEQLKKEITDLKTVNLNLKNWVAMNGPRFRKEAREE